MTVFAGPPRPPTPVPTVLILLDRDDSVEPREALLLRLPSLPGTWLAAIIMADLEALSTAVHLQFGDSATCSSHADNAWKQE